MKLTAHQFAEAAGVKVSTLDAYIARGYAPDPDGREGNRRYWLAASVDAWLASRPGQGSRTDLDQGRTASRQRGQ